MKSLYCLLIGFCSTFFASAQRAYFIYLQADNNSAFYVKVNEKILSSSSSGYLILPDLRDSTYHFSVGSPSSQKESKFTVTIAGKDRGFLIKDFDFGLGLFDLQNASVIRSKQEENDQNITYQRRNDEFSFLLSKAANDTSLLYAVIRKDMPVKKEEPLIAKETKPELALSESKNTEVKSDKDSVSDEPLNSLAAERKTDPLDSSKIKPETNSLTNVELRPEEKNNADSSQSIAVFQLNENSRPDAPSIDSALSDHNGVFRRSAIRRYAESSTSEGFGLIYHDDYGDGIDTIRLIIPNPRIVFKQAETDSLEQQGAFIQVSELNKDTIAKLPVVVSAKPKTILNTNCKSSATNADFLKLRKNMAAKETDEGMIDEAKKYFKSKCFSTEQIKNLSALFLSGAGKYQFFDAAYLHVTDQAQFSDLQSEIKDDYYLKRFKALVDE